MIMHEVVDRLLCKSKSKTASLKLLRRLWLGNSKYLTYADRVILTQYIMKARELVDAERKQHA
jgi:hypothetical protein